MKKLLYLATCCLTLCLSAGVYAEEELDFYDILDEVEEPQPEQITEGIIQSINLADRTIVVSGFKYYVAPATHATPVKVTLLGKSFGSFQLLEVGMAVRVIYFQAGEYLVGNRIEQIPDSEVVET